jgi:hypothetical protein
MELRFDCPQCGHKARLASSHCSQCGIEYPAGAGEIAHEKEIADAREALKAARVPALALDGHELTTAERIVLLTAQRDQAVARVESLADAAMVRGLLDRLAADLRGEDVGAARHAAETLVRFWRYGRRTLLDAVMNGEIRAPSVIEGLFAELQGELQGLGREAAR